MVNMRIKTVDALNKALETPYNIERDYKYLTSSGYLFHNLPKPLLELINYLSVDSMEHIDLLNEIIKDFEGLKEPRVLKYVINIDLETMPVAEIFQKLLYNQNVLETAYMNIYDNTEESLVRERYHGSLVIFFWLFKGLAQLEKKHYEMIIKYREEVNNQSISKPLDNIRNIEFNNR